MNQTLFHISLITTLRNWYKLTLTVKLFIVLSIDQLYITCTHIRKPMLCISYIECKSHMIIPRQTVFVGGYTVFILSVRPSVRTNESVSVTFCFLNILESHYWNFIKLCKNIHMYKANNTYNEIRARG